jgi:hypothetical protein
MRTKRPKVMISQSEPVDPREVRKALDVLLQADAVSELRVLQAQRQGTLTGYYDDRERLFEDAVRWSGHCRAVFVTLNPVEPPSRLRVLNRLIRLRIDQTDDSAIVRRRWLLIDIDPVRLPQTSSTVGQHEASMHRARQVRRWLTEVGWPQPILADSGNGTHLLYSLDLENTSGTTAVIQRALAGMDLRFSDSTVAIDASVWDAARFVKLYGTLAAKGKRTAERPHRLARMLEVPQELQVAARSLIEMIPKLPGPHP